MTLKCSKSHCSKRNGMHIAIREAEQKLSAQEVFAQWLIDDSTSADLSDTSGSHEIPKPHTSCRVPATALSACHNLLSANSERTLRRRGPGPRECS